MRWVAATMPWEVTVRGQAAPDTKSSSRGNDPGMLGATDALAHGISLQRTDRTGLAHLDLPIADPNVEPRL